MKHLQIKHLHLKQAIRNLHGCHAAWVEAVPVKETFQGQTVWEGAVQVFDLIDHPTAARCYAWSHATEGEKRRFVAVLHLGASGLTGEGCEGGYCAGTANGGIESSELPVPAPFKLGHYR